MKAFFDTSALVPVFYGDHEHHAASLTRFLEFGPNDGCCGAHSLAEIYSTLTGMPGKYRVTADQAMLFIGSVQERISIVALSADEYAAALASWSKLGITGGMIYDAVLATCALKADAGTIGAAGGGRALSILLSSQANSKSDSVPAPARGALLY